MYKGIGNKIAADMNSIMEGSQHRTIFSKTASKKSDDCDCGKKDCDCKKDKKKKKEKAGADKVAAAIDNIAKISAELDSLGYIKSSLDVLGAIDTIVSEAEANRGMDNDVKNMSDGDSFDIFNNPDNAVAGITSEDDSDPEFDVEIEPGEPIAEKLQGVQIDKDDDEQEAFIAKLPENRREEVRAILNKVKEEELAGKDNDDDDALSRAVDLDSLQADTVMMDLGDFQSDQSEENVAQVMEVMLNLSEDKLEEMMATVKSLKSDQTAPIDLSEMGASQVERALNKGSFGSLNNSQKIMLLKVAAIRFGYDV